MFVRGKLKTPDVLHAFLHVVLKQFEPVYNSVHSFGASFSITLKRSCVSSTKAWGSQQEIYCGSQSV